MADSDAITRLERRLKWETPEPLTNLSNQMTASLFSLIRTLAQWARASAEEKPLITLLFAFQAGYAVARIGRRNARR